MKTFDRSRFVGSNSLLFAPPWTDADIDWWKERMFTPHGIYPNDLGELLSASAKEPKVIELSDLDRTNDSFIIRVNGAPSESGEIWWHQRRLDLRGRLFEPDAWWFPSLCKDVAKGGC